MHSGQDETLGLADAAPGASAVGTAVDGPSTAAIDSATVAAREAGATALMRQYLDVKGRHSDALVFFRLGDFYEMFYEDAIYVAKTLGLTLTTRDRGKENPIPMCGVPHHSARSYIGRLIELGHRVALCEQLEDPRLVKGLVKRDVVRIITPGVTLDEDLMDPRQSSFVAAVTGEPRRGFGIAYCDVTTGDFRATEAPTAEALLDELARVEPRELLLSRGADDQAAEVAALVRRAYPRIPQTLVPDDAKGPPLDLAAALGEGFPAQQAAVKPLAIRAAARVLAYARATQKEAALPLSRLELYHRDDYLIIDEQARTHLELVETMLGRKRKDSLIDSLDQTCTGMGGRLLRRWLLFPLVDVAAIRRRHDAVETLVLASEVRARLLEQLAALADLERLAGRARLGVATPRDVAVLGRTLNQLPAVAETLAATRRGVATLNEPSPLLDLGQDLESVLANKIAAILRDDAPTLTKDGGLIRPGVSAELDELAAIASGGRDHLVAIEARERERTGIGSLKVKHNNVFGYFIEITRTHLQNVPADYIRKQTIANGERYITAELADYETKIATADERRITLELRLFEQLRGEVSAAAPRLMVLSARIAALDTIVALAEVASRASYVRPTVDDSRILHLQEARHPVIERTVATGTFVPNDVLMDADNEQLLLVTGPNMAGKSTLIRQVALAVILGQMGSFVPARAAHIGICDRVFTRVGAGDNLARGESTFMVEMRETAHILHNATNRSLVILDEIGRGTSTYDGVSIAWAVAEYLHDQIGARTLFATHYHELVALADQHARVRNVSVTAQQWNGDIVFLRKLAAGGASRSFGVDVAKLAGLPAGVVSRARQILASLEGEPETGQRSRPHSVQPAQGLAPQLALFPAAEDPETLRLREIALLLRQADPDNLSPRAAWDLLAKLRNKLTDPPPKAG